MTNIAKIVRWIGVILLTVMVLVTPWCLGSIHASVQQWLFPSVMISLVCALLTLLMDWKTRFSFPVLLIPILLMLVLIGMQLRPHDQATLAKRSPKVAELRELLLPAPDSAEYRFTQEIFAAALPGGQVLLPASRAVQSSADPAPTSIYPAATRHQLSLFVLVVSAFFAASVLFRDSSATSATRAAIYLFGASVVVNGCLLALFGILLRLNPHIKIFHVWENNRGTFSTFLNRNNAAGYLGMCLGLAIFYLLWYFFRSDREIEDSHRWDKRFEQAYMTTKHIVAYRLSRMITPGVLTWGLFAGILIAGVLVSMSRGGSLAMGAALLIGFLVVFATRRFKLSMLGFALIGIMGLGLIFWAGMDERVQKRLETIFSNDNTARPRNWSNAIETARDFQWRGSGFGTYQYANLLNDEFAKDNLIFVRAENQYIEIFLDLGMGGLLLLLACLITAIVLCWRLIWQHYNDWSTALGCGLLIVVITQAVASLFDFGLYITANALLLAVSCGILSAAQLAARSTCPTDNAFRGTEKPEEDADTSEKTGLSRCNTVFRGGLFVTGCLLLVMTHWGNKEIRNFAHIDRAMEPLAKIGDDRSVSPDEFADALAHLEAAIQLRPDDAFASLALAETQIGFYRNTIYREQLKVSGLQSPEDEIWAKTSLLSKHAEIGQYRRIGIITPIQIVREHPAVDQYLRPAFANLVRSRQSNPMSVGTHLLIAELVPLLDKDDNQQEFEQNAGKRVTTVSPLSAAAWYHTGILERNLGRTVNARAYWKQSLSLSRLYLLPIVRLTKGDMRGNNAQALFRETFPNSPDLFLTLVTKHFTQRETPDFARDALEALKNSCETAVDISEAERHYYRGRYEMLVGQYEAAIKELNAACEAQWSNHEWHYQLALACYNNRQLKEAEEEIKSALFYEPKNKTYLKLQETIQKAIYAMMRRVE